MDFPVSSTYVSELMPTKGRSRMLTATIAFQAVGQLVAALAAWLIIRQVDSETAWRFLVGSTAIPAIITLVARLSVPESPHWLMERGRNRQAAAIIGELIPAQRSLAQSLATQAGTLQDSQVSHQPAANYSELFSTPYLRTTILTAGAWFFMDIATYGVGLFTPVILTSLTGIQASAHGFNLMAQEFQSIQGTGLIDTFLLVGFLLGIWLVPKYGPIRMQIAGFGGMALSMVILTFASTLPADNSHRVGLIFLSFILFNLTMNAGPNSTTFLLPAQLFPTRLRGSGSGLAAASGKVGATLGIFFLPVIKDAYGTTLVLALMVVVSIMGYFITLIFSRKLARQARYGTQTSTP
jgi:MFS family permease